MLDNSDRWPTVSLGSIASIDSGGTPNRRNPAYWEPGTIPWVTTSEVNYSLITTTKERISEEGLRNSSARVFPEGTLLMALYGQGKTRGQVGLLGMAAATNQACAAITPIEEFTTGYLFYVLQKEYSRIRALSNSGGQDNLSAELVREIRVPAAPLREQHRIAEIVRAWDKALETLSNLRAAKLKRHRALTTLLGFGCRRLASFRETNEAEGYRWFDLPASWTCPSMGELAKEVSERNVGPEQLEVLSCSKHDGFVRSLDYFKKQVFSSDLANYKKIWRGDFGFPSNHIEEGSIGLQNVVDVGVVSPIYTVFRMEPEKVDADYAFAVLKTELYRHIFEISTSSSVNRRGSLRWREFSKLPFPLPPLKEQKAVADVLRTSRAEVDALGIEIEALTRQKRGLMQKLLTGEWRVVPDSGDVLPTN